jgi:short subunit dehydrogenase-like uncharacterized protein
MLVINIRCWFGKALNFVSLLFDDISNLKRKLPMMSREFDIIVYGAYGFTGELICEYLNLHYSSVKWAMAGRSEQSLKRVQATYNLPDTVEVIVVDAKDPVNLLEMTKRTAVVLNAAGPFALIGLGMVEACVAGGCHYCDITGEPQYVRSVIDTFHAKA